jgi:hypothetical protein
MVMSCQEQLGFSKKMFNGQQSCEERINPRSFIHITFEISETGDNNANFL